ncbi:MAG TPA: adenylate/guanylate cyclase domain-containing protein [Desulfosarcina sp.]|nr:adenylate/guanylate cyclase domain-containing protein [Desulfosarcina sp.]
MISYGPVLGVLPLRLWVHRRAEALVHGPVPSDQGIYKLPRQAFLADMGTWTLAGLIMVLIYALFFLPYLSTHIKVMAACLAFGVFGGMLGYLRIERRIIDRLKGETTFGAPPGKQLAMSKKVVALLVTVVGMMALTILLMVLLDVYYLIDRSQSQPEVYWGIFKEVVFALVVLLGIALVIVQRYAANLRAVLDAQLAAMDDISRGNLEKDVPVLSDDEFARIAERTNQMLLGLKERDFCRSSFDQYVSPEISRKILDKRIAPDGEILDVTVLFCDLRDYTNFAEKHGPEMVVTVMNRYFSLMEAVVRRHGGVVLQFIGDEIEAVFGAPEVDAKHPAHAVAAAMEMRRELDRFNAERRQQGEPEIRHGIGIHSGPVLAGNVGSERRKTYTLLGDTVNLASRLQVLNKQLATDILISGETRKRIGDADFPLRDRGRHAVKGKAETVHVFAVA